jgi:hypothetical protein
VIWQVLAIVISLGVMAAPDLLDLGDAVADAFHILGPIGVSVGAVAASAVLRPLRRLHLLLDPAIAASALLLGGGPAAMAVGLGAGALLLILAFPGAADPVPLGGGWRSLWERELPTSGPPERRQPHG